MQVEPRRGSLAPLLGVMAYWGYLSGVNGSIAPFLAESFALGDAGVAALMAWIGLSSLGALAFGRLVDRVGRRRVLLGCCTGLPLFALASALAPSPQAYVAAQLALYALGVTLLSTVTVVVCEVGDTEGRARGQGSVGTAFGLATALPLLLATALAGVPQGWRLVWGAAVLPLGLVPWLRARLTETRRWREADARGERGRMGDVFAPRYRARTLRVLLVVVLVNGAEFATRTWLFYHPVRSLGIAPATATLLLVAGGGLGLSGFGLGARAANRWGRRATFATSSAVFAASALGYYALSAHAGAWRIAILGASVFGLSAGGNAALVAFRSLTTELFPTHLRGTLGGWLAVGSALGWTAAMSGTSLLALLLGGLGPAVALLVGMALPAAALLLLRLPETAGLPLERTALEGGAFLVRR